MRIIYTVPGAIQEVPYAAHGEGFSFVLGLLDRKNRENNELLLRTTSQEVIMHDENSMHGEPMTLSSPENADNSAVECAQIVPHLQLLKKQQVQKRGKLLQMSVKEGVVVIESCTAAVRRRSLGTLGSCRIKGVSASGCEDLGYA